MITEISKACKQLINDTNTICNQARTQFTEKYRFNFCIKYQILSFFRNTRFENYLQNIDHSLDFVNEALTTGIFIKSIFFFELSITF